MKKFTIFRKIYDRALAAVGVDRVAHCVVCALMAVVGAMAAAKGEQDVPPLTLAVVGAGLAMGAGLMKEWADSNAEGDFFDWGDLAADFCGCLIGGAAVWGLM